MTGRRLPLAALALAALAAYALRLLLQAQSGASLHVDEAQYWDWSRTLQWGYYSKPPAIAALIRLSTALFGDSETGVRALAMACYPLAALVLAGLARDLSTEAGTQAASRAALWTAGLFLASPIAGLLGLAATTDGLLVLCWALAMAALWRAVVRGQALAWWVFGLACGVGLLSKYAFAALMAGAAGFVLQQGLRRHGLRFAGACALALLLCVPHLLWNQAEGWPTLRHTAEITVQAERHQRSLGASLGALAEFSAGQWLIFGPLLLPGWLWLRRGRAATPALVASGRALLLWTCAPLALMGLAQAARGGAQINWIVPAHLALVLAAGCEAAVLRTSAARALGVLLAVQVALVSAVAVAPRIAQALGRNAPPALDAWVRMRGWADDFAALAPALRTLPGARVIGTSRTLLAQGAYHWRDFAPPRAAWPVQRPPANHYELSCPWQPGAAPEGPLLVLSEGAEPPAGFAPGALTPFAEARHTVAPRRVLELRLWRLQPPVPDPQSSPVHWCR